MDLLIGCTSGARNLSETSPRRSVREPQLLHAARKKIFSFHPPTSPCQPFHVQGVDVREGSSLKRLQEVLDESLKTGGLPQSPQKS
jgi:hypothetical protein